jgi:predicted transcriptional regulator
MIRHGGGAVAQLRTSQILRLRTDDLCYRVIEMADRTMTVRLPEDQANALEALAAVQGRSIADVIRQAIGDYVERCRSDRSFQAQVEASLDRHRTRLLEGLGLGSGGIGTSRRRQPSQ